MKYIILCLFFILSCTSTKIKPDNTPIAASEAHYPSAELKVNGKVISGLNIISVKPGTELTSVDFQVWGYNKGKVRITSKNCEMDSNVSYAETGYVKIPLKGKINKDCLFSVVVTTEFKKQQNSAVKIFPEFGFFAIKVTDISWVGASRKIAVNDHNTLKINSGDTKPVIVNLSGCGVEFKKEILPVDGVVEVPVHEAIDNEEGTCVLDGVLISPDFKNLYVNVLVSTYNNSYVPLAIPTIEIDKNIKIEAESNVAVIVFDAEDEVNNTANFKFIEGDHVVRLITAKGRHLIGVYKNKEWKWIQ